MAPPAAPRSTDLRGLFNLIGERGWAHEWVLTVVVAPVLMFPTEFAGAVVLAFVALASIWTLQLRAGSISRRLTPLVWPVTALAVAACLGSFTSAFPEYTVPKLASIVLGIAVFRAIVLGIDRPASFRWGVVACAGLGLGLVVVGGAATAWTNKFPMLSALARLMPQNPLAVGTGQTTWNPNALGGTTAAVLPLFVTLLAWAIREQWRPRTSQASPVVGLPATGVLLCTCGALVTILVFSQSRTAWFAAVATLWLMAVAGRRPVRWVAVVALLVAVAAGWQYGAAATGGFAPAQLDGESAADMSGRLRMRPELWARGIYLVQAEPVRGVGLGAFRQVTHESFPPDVPDLPPASDVAHSHNVFIQTALDIGLPGLVAYMATLTLAAFMAVRVFQRGDAFFRAAILGLGGNLVAMHLFGLADAIPLGAKVGILFWMNLGLIASAYRLTCRPRLTAGTSVCAARARSPEPRALSPEPEDHRTTANT